MDLLDPQCTLDFLKVNQYDIVFKRLGTPLFGGQISYLNPTIDGDKKQLQVTATGWFDLLDYRYIYEGFPDYNVVAQQLIIPTADSSLIAWGLVNDTQFPVLWQGSVEMTGVTPTMNQSFVAQGTSTVSTIKLMLQQSGTPTGNLVVGIYTDSGGGVAPVGLVANSQQTIPVSSLPASTDVRLWYEIDYSSNPPQLTSGNTYWIKCYLDTAQSAGNGVLWYYLDGANLAIPSKYYQSGKPYSPESPALFGAYQDLQFFIILADNSYQMTKNTYLGFIQGNLPTSFNLSPTFSAYKKIKQCVEDVACASTNSGSNTLTGIDFSVYPVIDPVTNNMTRVFNTYYPRQGIDNTFLPFNYPGNIKKFDTTKDAKTLENDITVRGNGTGLAQVSASEVDNVSVQTYGQKQDIEDVADISDTPTLDALAIEFLRIRKDPLDIPEVTLDGNYPPVIGSYWVGDTIQFNIVDIPIIKAFGNQYRIEQIDVTISDDDAEEIVLSVSTA
jgi:hypothetical protein